MKILYYFVSDSPYCGSEEPQIVGVALMENAELPCDVVSNPKKLVFHWSFNNSADGTPLTLFNTNGSRQVKFMFSKKAIKIDEIFTVDLTP